MNEKCKVQGELALTVNCLYFSPEHEQKNKISIGKLAQCKVNLHVHSYAPDAAKTPMSETFKVRKVQGELALEHHVPPAKHKKC